MKLSDAVDEIIRLGDAIRVYWDRELRLRHPRYPIVQEGVDDGPPPPESAQLEALLNCLTDEQVYTILLLLSVGRGEFQADCLEQGYQITKELTPTRKEAVAQILDSWMLVEFLPDAVDAVRNDGLDLDELHCEAPVTVN